MLMDLEILVTLNSKAVVINLYVSVSLDYEFWK